jgi:transporter family-2 protein
MNFLNLVALMGLAVKTAPEISFPWTPPPPKTPEAIPTMGVDFKVRTGIASMFPKIEPFDFLFPGSPQANGLVDPFEHEKCHGENPGQFGWGIHVLVLRLHSFWGSGNNMIAVVIRIIRLAFGRRFGGWRQMTEAQEEIDIMSVTGLIVLAVIGGIAVTIQGQFMGLLDKNIGTLESVFITYSSGGILAAVAMIASRGGNLKAVQTVPWYALSAGLMGLVIVGTIGYTVPRLGLSKAFTVIVASQFLVASILDHYGLLGAAVRPMDLSRLAGMILLVAGVWLIVK